MDSTTRSYLSAERERINAVQNITDISSTFAQRVPEFALKDRLLCYFDPMTCRNCLSLIGLLPFFETVAYKIDPSFVFDKAAYEREFGMSLHDSIDLFESGRLLPVIDTLGGLVKMPSYLSPMLRLSPPSLQRIVSPYSQGLRFIPYEMEGVNYMFVNEETRRSPAAWYKAIAKTVLQDYVGPDDLDRLLNVILLYTQYAGYEFGYLAIKISLDMAGQGCPVDQIASIVQQIAGHFTAFVIGPQATPLLDSKAVADITHGAEIIRKMRRAQSLRIGPASEELIQELPTEMQSNHDTVPVQMYADLPDATNLMDAANIAKFHSFLRLAVPRAVGDPMALAKRTEKSGNVKEHWRLLREFGLCLAEERYQDGCALIHSGWRTLATELKTEIESIERTYARTTIEISIATSILGTVIGGALGQLLSRGDLALYFAVVGAHAANVLTGNYKEKVAKQISRPLGVKNLSFMIWKAIHK